MRARLLHRFKNKAALTSTPPFPTANKPQDFLSFPQRHTQSPTALHKSSLPQAGSSRQAEPTAPGRQRPEPRRQSQQPPGAEGPQQARPGTAPQARFLPLPPGRDPHGPLPRPAAHRLLARAGSQRSPEARSQPSDLPTPPAEKRREGRGRRAPSPGTARSAQARLSPAKIAARDAATPFRARRASPRLKWEGGRRWAHRRLCLCASCFVCSPISHSKAVRVFLSPSWVETEIPP